MTAPPAYHIASVGRALTLLSVFAARRVLSVSEAAEILDVAPSTAHRMLQMLVYHGFVIRSENRTYRRGPGIEAFRSDESRVEETKRLAMPRLISLRDALPGGTPHLMTLEGNGGRFIAGVQTTGETRMATCRTGWLLPAHTLAGGRVLIAQLPASEVDALYPDGLPPTRHSRLRSMEELHRQLEIVRARGFAVSHEAHRDIRAIGVAVPSVNPGLAVSVAWDEQSFPATARRRVLQEIRAAATDLAEILGTR